MVLPQMAERGGGSVVIVSSVGGLARHAGDRRLRPSKAADMALARNICRGVGPEERARQLHRAGPRAYRFRPRALGEPGRSTSRPSRAIRCKPHRRARRDRRRRRVPRVARRHLHDRPDARHRRRRHGRPAADATDARPPSVAASANSFAAIRTGRSIAAKSNSELDDAVGRLSHLHHVVLAGDRVNRALHVTRRREGAARAAAGGLTALAVTGDESAARRQQQQQPSPRSSA